MIFIATVAYICNNHIRHIGTNVVYRWTQCDTWITLLHRHIHTKSLGERTVFTMYVEEFSHIHVVAEVLCPWGKTLTNVNTTAAQSQQSDCTWFFLWCFVSTPPSSHWEELFTADSHSLTKEPPPWHLQSHLSKPVPHQKEPQGLPLHPPLPPQVGVRGNCVCSSCPCPLPSWNLSGTPPSGPVGLVWSHFSQEGCPDPSTDWTGAPQTCLEFFRRQIGCKGETESSVCKAQRTGLGWRCLCLIRALQRPWGSPLGVTFLVPVLKLLQLTS